MTAAEPVVNITDYPDLEKVHKTIKDQTNSNLVDAKTLAKEAGAMRAVNMVLVGSLSVNLPIKADSIKEAIRDKFISKGEDIVNTNLKAFNLGREAGGK